MLIIEKWLGAMLVAKDESPVKFIKPGIGEKLTGIIMTIFINSPKTKFIVHVPCVLLKLVTKDDVIEKIMLHQ